MEQAANYQIQIQHLFCHNHNNAKLLCCKDKCQNCALICRYETCNCLMKQHSECQFVYTETFINKLTKKKRVLTKELEQGFKAVERVYDQAIQLLSKDKERVTIWKDNYGLNEDQIKFINAIIQNNRTELNGNLVNKVKNNLSQENDEEGINGSMRIKSKNFGTNNQQNLDKSERIQLNFIFLLSIQKNKIIFNLISALKYKKILNKIINERQSKKLLSNV